ncbi:hypothetical protein HHK36_018908 [Tetracentron sinense]|uniref:Uncharacterized protein n=1 Tax=Tetracentron sinense TaxID=13715 RepID=A0A835DCA7_TETSI|nr:hypothetical protein HHK36_018908 [Tetracentron sinense]
MPIGTIIRLTRSQPFAAEIGCMNNLYESVYKLDVQHLWTAACKTMLLCPQNSAETHCKNLKVNINDTGPSGTTLAHQLRQLKAMKVADEDRRRVFLNDPEWFMISDDLHVTSMSTMTSLSLLHKLGIKDWSATEERTVNVELFGGNSPMQSLNTLYKSVEELSVDNYIKSEECKNMLLHPKLPSYFSCENQLLPIEEVSLYYSTFDCSSCYPTLVISTSENDAPHQCQHPNYTNRLTLKVANPKLLTGDPIHGGGFLRRPKIFMVTDDLVVTPFSPISAISLLDSLNVPISDVEERVVTVSKKEVGTNLYIDRCAFFVTFGQQRRCCSSLQYCPSLTLPSFGSNSPEGFSRLQVSLDQYLLLQLQPQSAKAREALSIMKALYDLKSSFEHCFQPISAEFLFLIA